MKLEEIKKHIDGMDKKSEEFFEIFKHLNDKYWTFEKPDSWQQAGQLINSWLFRGKAEEHIVIASMVKEMFMMRHEKRKACTGTVGFTDETFHFDIYTTEVEKDNMNELMLKAHEAMKSGDIKVSSGKFGKNYYKKSR